MAVTVKFKRTESPSTAERRLSLTPIFVDGELVGVIQGKESIETPGTLHYQVNWYDSARETPDIRPCDNLSEIKRRVKAALANHAVS